MFNLVQQIIYPLEITSQIVAINEPLNKTNHQTHLIDSVFFLLLRHRSVFDAKVEKKMNFGSRPINELSQEARPMSSKDVVRLNIRFYAFGLLTCSFSDGSFYIFSSLLCVCVCVSGMLQLRLNKKCYVVDQRDFKRVRGEGKSDFYIFRLRSY